MQVTVVGDRERRLFELDGPFNQVVDPVGAIEQRVLGMAMQVYE